MNVSVRNSQPYDLVAAEYYLKERHPTCFNFGELSSRFIVPRLSKVIRSHTEILEIGAGRTTAGSILVALKAPLSNLVLLDRSIAMLSHSNFWRSLGAKMIVADACATGLANTTFDIIVASLGDPYNSTGFWREIARLLRPRGRCLFTTPAYEWASRYRERDAQNVAEFILSDGRKVNVPSLIPSLHEQLTIFDDCYLSVDEVVTFSLSDLHEDHSPKLEVFGDITSKIVLRGFVISKS
jgi:SAM-dependent methyltransferase